MTGNEIIYKKANIKSQEYWMLKLGLVPHVEGGYYKESIRSEDTFLEKKTNKERSFISSIYYLIDKKVFSHLHRLSSDEIWYFQYGGSITIHCILPDGTYTTVKLGSNHDELLQYNVKKGTIFGASYNFIDEKEEEDIYGYSLIGCAVSPGFTMDEFELFTKSTLLELFPQHKELINKFAYDVLPLY